MEKNIQETIKELNFFKEALHNGMFSDKAACFDEAITALGEVQKYRTMEERLNGVSLLSLGEHFLRVAEKGEDEGWQHGLVLSNEDADRWNTYKTIGTVEECWKARKLQQPKEPHVKIQCPSCYTAITGTDCYCRHCGQAIKRLM